MSKIDSKVPIGLYTLQKWFGKVITTPIINIDEKGIPTIDDAKHKEEAKRLITPNKFLSSDQRIGIYKMQYWLRLFELLKEDFPFVLRLFGNDLFEEKIATPYLIKYPPNTWDLNFLGEMLAKWIEDNYQDGSDKKLLYYAAVIDTAYFQVFFAPEFDQTSNISEETKIYLQPFVRVFELDADLFSFREKFLEQDPNYWLENDFPRLSKNKKFYTVLYRDYNKAKYSKISKGEYLLLKAFEMGSSIEGAFQNFPEKLMKKADIELWFKTWSENNWLTNQKGLRS